jgi:hypothetical protein
MPTDASPDRTVTGFFERQRDAEAAIRRLHDIGVERDQVTMVQRAIPPEVVGGRARSAGLLGSFGDMITPRSDVPGFAEGPRNGYLVSVRTEAEHHDQVMQILGDAGSVGLDEHPDASRF